MHSSYLFISFFSSLTLLLCTVKANLRSSPTVSKRNFHHSLQQSPSSKTFMTLIHKLTASNGKTGDNFGGENAVAISNNCIIVGANGYNNNQGAVYVFMDPNDPDSGRSYSEMAILLASNGQSGDYFGDSVDIHGDIIVIGATYSDAMGAVYIFRILNDSTNYISQIAIITADTGMEGDSFGTSVSIHGNFILVGAPYVDTNDSNDVGSAYLFANPSNDPNNPAWTQIMQFQPIDLTKNVYFGISVAMNDHIAVVGTWDVGANAAYVFEPVDDVDPLSPWTQMAKLTGTTESFFEYSVAVSGNNILVSAYEDDNTNGIAAGSVFVFTKINNTDASLSIWTEITKLFASDGAEGNNFGISVSISKDASTIVVGADHKDVDSNITNSGAVYLFHAIDSATMMNGWTQVGKFVAADKNSDDNLGSSLAVQDSIAVVGAWADDNMNEMDVGAVYILDTGNLSFLTPTSEPILTLQPTQNSSLYQTNVPNTMQPTTTATTPSQSSDTLSPTAQPAKTLAPSPMASSMNVTNSPTNVANTKAGNSTIIIVTIVGAVIVVLGTVLGFFNYRLKREKQQQQQQQLIPEPPPLAPFFGNHLVAADEIPIMATVFSPLSIVEPTEDRTLEAEVLLDPAQMLTAAATSSVVNMDTADAGKKLPHFKDQVQNTIPTTTSQIPIIPELPQPTQQQQQQQQQQQEQHQCRDPPAALHLH